MDDALDQLGDGDTAPDEAAATRDAEEAALEAHVGQVGNLSSDRFNAGDIHQPEHGPTPSIATDFEKDGGPVANRSHGEAPSPQTQTPDAGPETPSLHEQRLGAVLAVLKAAGAQSVLDLGCGEGRLLRLLLRERQFTRILGLEVSHRALEMAADKLRYDRLPAAQKERLQLVHGSLMYRDARLAGYDAAAVVEVVEHLDPPRLAAFERVLFACARPGTVVITTPNREYNVKWETLPAGKFRHRDHRFEWTRAEFRAWAEGIAARFGYAVRFLPVGPEDAALGAPTQMGVFSQ